MAFEVLVAQQSRALCQAHEKALAARTADTRALLKTIRGVHTHYAQGLFKADECFSDIESAVETMLLRWQHPSASSPLASPQKKGQRFHVETSAETARGVKIRRLKR